MDQGTRSPIELSWTAKNAIIHIFLDGLETFRMIWKPPQNDLKTFWMVWKLYGWSGNFPDGLKTFQMIWKLSVWCGNFSVGLETFQVVWKLSRWPGNFPDGLKTYKPISVHKLLQKCINVNVAKTIYALFWCICCEHDLLAPSGKFLRVKICHPESLDFFGLWLEMEPLGKVISDIY